MYLIYIDMITNFIKYNESLRDKMIGAELPDELKTPEGIRNYIQQKLRTDLNAHGAEVNPISDHNYNSYKDKIPNRDLAFEYLEMHSYSLKKDIMKFIEQLGYDAIIKRIVWGDEDEYIIIIKDIN